MNTFKPGTYRAFFLANQIINNNLYSSQKSLNQISPIGEVLFFKEKYPKELPRTIAPAGFTALLDQLRTLQELARGRLTTKSTLLRVGIFQTTYSTELARFMAGSNSPRLTRN